MKSALLLPLAVITLCPVVAKADTVTLGNGYSGTTSPTNIALNYVLYGQSGTAVGGNVPDSSGTIGASDFAFSSLFCVQMTAEIGAGATYSATYTNDGTIDSGTPIPNAGQVAWLIENLASTATTEGDNVALQAAVWKTEYGSSLTVNGIDNPDGSLDAAATETYYNDLALLGSNTAPVDLLEWITPENSDGSLAQGLVGVVAPTPEPSSIALLGTGLLGAFGVGRSRFRARARG